MTHKWWAGIRTTFLLSWDVPCAQSATTMKLVHVGGAGKSVTGHRLLERSTRLCQFQNRWTHTLTRFQLLNGAIHSALPFVGNKGRLGILHVSKIVCSPYTKMRPNSVQFSKTQFRSIQFNLTQIIQINKHLLSFSKTWTRNQTLPYAQNVLQDLSLPTLDFISHHAHSFSASLTGLLAVPCMFQECSCPRAFHLLLSFPGKTFGQIST